MNNFSEEAMAQELYKNFLDSLNIISAKLMITAMEKQSFPDLFEKREFLNNIVIQWKDGIKIILQKKINDFHNLQSDPDKPDVQKFVNAVLGVPNIEDIQKISNDAYKSACKQVDLLIEMMLEDE
jgi:hypothetical protein